MRLLPQPAHRWTGGRAYPVASLADSLEETTPSPVGPRGDPSDGARVRAVAAGASSPGDLGDERRHPHPLRHRSRRPRGGRPTPATDLRRAAHARRPAAGPGEARPDAPADGPGPRGLSPAGG